MPGARDPERLFMKRSHRRTPIVVGELRAAGLIVRDVAHLPGLTPSRISQIEQRIERQIEQRIEQREREVRSASGGSPGARRVCGSVAVGRSLVEREPRVDDIVHGAASVGRAQPTRVPIQVASPTRRSVTPLRTGMTTT
jgi:hypothetical protein